MSTGGAIRALFHALAGAGAPGVVAVARRFADGVLRGELATCATPPHASLTEPQLGRLVMQYAPLALHGSHATDYQALLTSLSIALPDPRSPAFAHHAGLDDAAFLVPTFALALASSSQRYGDELIGFSIFARAQGLYEPLRRATGRLRRRGAATAFLDAQRPVGMRCADIDVALRTHAGGEERVWRGFEAVHRLSAFVDARLQAVVTVRPALASTSAPPETHDVTSFH